MAALSFARSVASGNTPTFSVPFGYLDKSHVKVYLDGVLKVQGTDYTWPTNGSIQFTSGNPPAGVVVERRRITPVDKLVSFGPGNLSSADLNTGDLQPLFLAQEADDKANDLTSRGWVSTDFGSGGEITKGSSGAVPVFDAEGNLTDTLSPPTVEAIRVASEGLEAGLAAFKASRHVSRRNLSEGLIPGRPYRQPRADYSSAYPDTEIIGISEGKHQAFGNATLDPITRRVYTTWRRGDIHAVAGAGHMRMKRFDQDGAVPVIEAEAGGAYTTLAIPPPGRDYRDPSPCIDPLTGNLVLLFNDTPASGAGTTYFRRMISKDGGNTFSDPLVPDAIVATIPNAYARVYGGLRYQVSTDPSQQGELISTAYYRDAASNLVLDYYVSRDGGVTWKNSQGLGEAFITDTDGTNETALVGVDAKLWFAFGRATEQVWMKISTDGRKSWSAWEQVPPSIAGSQAVAPDALLVHNSHGVPYILLAISDRSGDRLRIVSAPVSDLVQRGVDAFPQGILTFNTSNAYPSLVDFGNGSALVTFTREYTGQTYASLHLGYLNYGKLINRPYGFRCNLAANKTGIAVGTPYQVPFDSFSSGFAHGFTLTGGKIKVKKQGRLRLGWKAGVTVGNADGSIATCSIKRNGTDVAIEYVPSPGTGSQTIGASADVNCAYGDELEAYVSFTGGTARTIVSTVATMFFGEYLGDYG